MDRSRREAALARQRFVAIAVAAVVLIVGVLAYAGWERAHRLKTPDFEGQGNDVVEIVRIPSGSSMSELGPELAQRGIVASNAAFQRAAASDPSAARVTPGFYRLHEKMSADAAVKALLDPKNKVESLKVPGGATLMDINVIGGTKRLGIYSNIAKISCADGTGDACVTVAQLENAAATTDPAALGVPAWAQEQVRARGADPKRLEGLIAPGEYAISPEQNAQQILKELVTASAQTYEKTGLVEQAKTAGFTPYQLLTAASLVERESPAGQFPKVARVIFNRLAKPMRLEFDSTVNYGLANQEVATTPEDRARVTPWNTYAKDGLPDTPIASPSVDALKAVEHPAPGDWLFFVTIDKNGTTVFNRTFDEHLRDTQKAIDGGVLDSQRDVKPPAHPGPPAPPPAPAPPAPRH